jgi:hypothetical protein
MDNSFEYKEVYISRDEFVSELNKLSKDGWRLVKKLDNGDRVIVLLERKVIKNKLRD